MTDLASLRIAEDRIEWAVECDVMTHRVWFPSRNAAEVFASGHEGDRVVSRRVIVTEWAEQ